MTVDVIIRTLAEAGRGGMLMTAVDSLVNCQRCLVRPIIVVNGDRYDAGLIAQLQKMPRLELISISGGLQEATIAGRAAVTTPYFAFLDDDDQYLPGGIDAMLGAIEAQPEADVVVTNGYKVDIHGAGRPIIEDVDETRRAPLVALRTANWLHSGCGTIFRSASFSADWFDDATLRRGGGLFEWTWIAYKASLGKTLFFCPAFTYQVNETPKSMSKSFAMVVYEDEFLRRLDALPLPRTELEFLRRKHGAALHAISDACRQRGNCWRAALYHFRSMLKPGGWRYLAYTRRLIAAYRPRAEAAAVSRAYRRTSRG